LIPKKVIIEWPPIVKGIQIPFVMKLRDLVLTLMAWALLMYFMHDLWALIYEYIKDTILKIDASNLVDWLSIWTRIAPFFYVASLLVLWVLILGSLRRRAIRSAGLIKGMNALRTVQQQFPLKHLELDLLAKRFGVEKSQLAQWQSMRTVDVSVDNATGYKTIVEVKN